MRAGLAATASAVPELLSQQESFDVEPNAGGADDRWLRGLIALRNDFGITRIGSITRLDRIGIPIVQVVRPLSLSNAVSQGKGMTWGQAAASALMETVEAWAGENILGSRLHISSIADLGPSGKLYEPWLVNGAPVDWKHRPLPWIEGWDLFSSRKTPVPTALVDTVYTMPSPHPVMFPRTTTGMGAGRSLLQAIIHAGLEILERDAIARARRTRNFFDLYQVGLQVGGAGPCADLLARIRAAGLLLGLWQAPAPHDLPIYWCHLMEGGPPHELVPLPSEGFGCGFTHEHAVVKAILEACQARATAISGAREDLTRFHYPPDFDRAHLAEWREQLLSAAPLLRLSSDHEEGVLPERVHMDRMLDGLRRAGAEAAVVVPLYDDVDNRIHVARLIAPPLHLNPRD